MMVKLHSYDNMSLGYRICPAMGKLESSKLLHKRGNESHTVYKTAFPPPGHPYRRPESLASIPGREGHRWRFPFGSLSGEPPRPQTGHRTVGRKKIRSAKHLKVLSSEVK